MEATQLIALLKAEGYVLNTDDYGPESIVYEKDVVLAYHTYHEYNRHTGIFMCRYEHSIYRYAPQDQHNPFHEHRYTYANGEYELA